MTTGMILFLDFVFQMHLSNMVLSFMTTERREITPGRTPPPPLLAVRNHPQVSSGILFDCYHSTL